MNIRWWTRSPRIRTAGEFDFQAILFEGSIPVYQRIAAEVARLRALGLSLAKIAKHLGFSKMTIVRALGSARPSALLWRERRCLSGVSWTWPRSSPTAS
jgi:hypothetical protein